MRLGLLVGLLAAFGPEPLLPGKPFVLRGHTEAITALAFSPDGLSLASAGRDRQVKLWTLATGEAWLTIPGAEEQINALAFSRDGKRLAIGETALKFRVVALPEGRVVNEIAHPDSVSGLSFSPDGARVAVSGQRNGGAVYVLATGKPAYSFRGRSAQFSKDGAALLVANEAGSLGLLDARSGTVLKTVSTLPQLPFAEWSADGSRIATWSGDEPEVHLWTGAKLERGGVVEGGHAEGSRKPRVVGIALSGDGQGLLIGTGDGALRLWDLSARTVIKAWPVEQVAVVALSSGWVAAGDGALIKLWRRSRGKLP